MQVKLQGLESFKTLDEVVDHKILKEQGDEIFLDVIQQLVDEAVEQVTKEARGYKNEAIRLAKVLADKEAKEHQRAVERAERQAEREARKEQREKEKAERQKIREAEKEQRRIAKEQEKEQRRLEKEAKEQRKQELKELTDKFVDEEGQ